MVEIPKKLEIVLRWIALVFIIIAAPITIEAFGHFNLSILWWEVSIALSAGAAGVALFLYLTYNYGRFGAAITFPVLAFVILLIIRIIAIRGEKEENIMQKIVPWIGMSLGLTGAIIVGAGLADWSKFILDNILLHIIGGAADILAYIRTLTLPMTIAYVGMIFFIIAFGVLMILEIYEIKNTYRS